LQVNYKSELLELVSKKESYVVHNINTLIIQFDGFLTHPYHSICIKLDLFNDFQSLLNYIFALINKEVSPYTYTEKWILYNSRSSFIIIKENNSGNRTLKDLGIELNDKLICYKK